MELGINYLAIVVATIVSFIIGFLWYAPLFGKAWAKEMKFDTSVKPPSSVMMRGMSFMLIGNFLMAYVFAHNMAAWTFVPGMDVMPVSGTILNSAIFTWLGFFVPGDLSRVAWERHSWKLFGINTAYHLINLLVVATILAMWR